MPKEKIAKKGVPEGHGNELRFPTDKNHYDKASCEFKVLIRRLKNDSFNVYLEYLLYTADTEGQKRI